MRSLFLSIAVARNVARHVEQVTVSAEANDLGFGGGRGGDISDAEFRFLMRQLDDIEATAPRIPNSVRRAYEKKQRKEYEKKMGIKKPGMWSRISSAWKSDKKKTDPAEELAQSYEHIMRGVRTAGEAATGPPPRPLKFGPRVRLTGLKSQPGLNGELADMVSDETDGRIEVQLKCKGSSACENLKVIRVTRDKLEDPAVAFGGELKVESRTREQYYDLSNTHVAGRTCRVEGTSQDALNGKGGTIVGLLPPQPDKPPRFEVRLHTQELKSLKAGNIVLA